MIAGEWLSEVPLIMILAKTVTSRVTYRSAIHVSRIRYLEKEFHSPTQVRIRLEKLQTVHFPSLKIARNVLSSGASRTVKEENK